MSFLGGCNLKATIKHKYSTATLTRTSKESKKQFELAGLLLNFKYI